jgi:hypothetical protein
MDARGAGEDDTPREKGSPLKTTEAEPVPWGTITLHDASMGGHLVAAAQKVNVARDIAQSPPSC